MDKAIEYGWSYETIYTDSNIGNSYADFVRQGFSTIADTFTGTLSAISESFMGQESFKTLDVKNEQDANYSLENTMFWSRND